MFILVFFSFNFSACISEVIKDTRNQTDVPFASAFYSDLYDSYISFLEPFGC